MKIGILTIATGKYSIFLEELIESSRKNFLPGNEVFFFVFTDDPNLSGPDIIRLHQEKIGWPFDSMLRFHMFLGIESYLGKMDYVFFMNANCRVEDRVGEEILPLENECGITAALHPGFFGRDFANFPFEFRTESEFYHKPDSGSLYFQGCFNGGRTKEFLKMSKILKNKVDMDLAKKFVPIWHDESALNWFLIGKDPVVLPPTYAYPEFDRSVDIERILKEKNTEADWKDMISDFSLAKVETDPHFHIIREFGNPKIVMRDKNKKGGKIFLRK